MLPTVEPVREKPRTQAAALHPALFVMSWIALSSVVILFNKYLLDTLGFHYPAILTCWHLAFSTLATQILAKTTTLLDGRKTVKMTRRVYVRAIIPIGILYSLSLVCSNLVYLHLSVAFTQMLKASAPVAVLLTSWSFGVSKPSLRIFINVLFIVLGVALASYGEVDFVWIGFVYQLGGIVFEAMRLVMTQKLLCDDEGSGGQHMDPLVSLYYYAPVCAVMNLAVAAVTEFPTFDVADLQSVGPWVLVLNAAVVFFLNVASVFLIGKTSGLVMTLCGVLKNILIVVASVMIWGTIVSPLQILGYSIALAGLVYYGVGYQGIRTYFKQLLAFFGAWRTLSRTKKLLASLLCFVSVFGLFQTWTSYSDAASKITIRI
ncbi:duf250 domain membrane protein [Phlyctema vagabunda]|uniref:Duf250 domain membrane protein n=1 Tax=Phlyctema vagabunda TaxID=108571 RepID=A0ABR4PIS7_9HELO